MRHLVNVGLLFGFVTLAASGVMAYILPFSIDTTRIHVVFGLTTLVLVGLHLLGRVKYFRNQFRRRGGPGNRIPAATLTAIALAWVGLLVIALRGLPPTGWLMDRSYEARHRAAIVRAAPQTGGQDTGEGQRVVARVPTQEDGVPVSLRIDFGPGVASPPACAVWTESPTGAMIETLYLDQALAFSDRPKWGGAPTPRHHILPLWRHRYTLVSGVDPHGEVDVFTAATPTHGFTLDDYLRVEDGQPFVVCVEVNAPGDPNDLYPDPHLGQPSLLYTAYVESDPDTAYTLLELTGHGGGAEQSGAIHYDLDGFTTAKHLVELLLLRTGQTAVGQF